MLSPGRHDERPIVARQHRVNRIDVIGRRYRRETVRKHWRRHSPCLVLHRLASLARVINHAVRFCQLVDGGAAASRCQVEEVHRGVDSGRPLDCTGVRVRVVVPQRLNDRSAVAPVPAAASLQRFLFLRPQAPASPELLQEVVRLFMHNPLSRHRHVHQRLPVLSLEDAVSRRDPLKRLIAREHARSSRRVSSYHFSDSLDDIGRRLYLFFMAATVAHLHTRGCRRLALLYV